MNDVLPTNSKTPSRPNSKTKDRNVEDIHSKTYY